MFRHTAVAGFAPHPNVNIRRFLGVRLGAHRVPETGNGRLMCHNYNVANCQATANALQAGTGVWVDDAPLAAAGEFVCVSGLTACIGVIVLVRHGNQYGHAVVAHFNGNYHDAAAWADLANGAAAGGAGARFAVVISTSDTSAHWQGVVEAAFGPHLTNLVGVDPGRILFYHSSTSGVRFLVRRDGLMGEPSNMAHYPY
ncbi:MAG: hypothetical protein KF850_19845 [Labilithrix sp.]|nr:hypothetical protein [Labilithrix sp.]MBX3214298.1 hypothetical protein [Labilithrix sp.]